MPNVTPHVVSKYQILELVGEGAMGSVYRAHDPLLNRTVAIKVMSDAIARDGVLRDRFLREAQAAGSLQHPNVVTVYDFGEHDGHLFIAMEFVDGVDLDQLITGDRALSLVSKLDIIVDVLVGLSYAHKHGVVHRDIKPANIRVLPEGHAKIMDFGVAHLESVKMTATGVMVGTPNYMAPEQVTGGKIAAPTDIFSTAAVLYEILTGRRAFTGDTLHAVLFQVVSVDPPPLSVVAPALPAALDTILQRGFDKDPERRYQSAQEMANDLTGVRALLGPLDGSASLSLSATIAAHMRAAIAERPSATPATPPVAALPPQSPPARGRPWRVAAGAVAVMALGGLWIATRRPAPPPTDARVAEPTEPALGTSIPAVDSADAVGTPTPPATVRAPGVDSASATGARADGSPPSGSPPARSRAAGTPAVVPPPVRRDRSVAAPPPPPPAPRVELPVRSTDARPLTDTTARVSDSIRLPRPTSASAVPRAPSRETSTSVDSSASLAAARALSRSEGEEVSDIAAIGALVSAYARAIEGRDIQAVRARYPAMTSEQEGNFTRFFGSVSALRVVLTPSAVDVTGGSASSRIDGTYEYTDQSGKRQRQAVSFRATFRREGREWRISAVH